eukprot:Em0003g16a
MHELSPRHARRKLLEFKENAEVALWFAESYGLAPTMLQLETLTSHRAVQVDLRTKPPPAIPIPDDPAPDEKNKLLQCKFLQYTRAYNCTSGMTVLTKTDDTNCRFSAGRHFRHAMLNDILHRALLSANVPSRLEPTGLNRADDNHTLAVVKMPESYQLLSETLHPLLDGIQALMASKCIEVGGKVYKLEFYLGGDLKVEVTAIHDASWLNAAIASITFKLIELDVIVTLFLSLCNLNKDFALALPDFALALPDFALALPDFAFTAIFFPVELLSPLYRTTHASLAQHGYGTICDYRHRVFIVPAQKMYDTFFSYLSSVRTSTNLAQFIGRAQRVMSGETNDVADVPHWTYLSSRKSAAVGSPVATPPDPTITTTTTSLSTSHTTNGHVEGEGLSRENLEDNGPISDPSPAMFCNCPPDPALPRTVDLQNLKLKEVLKCTEEVARQMTLIDHAQLCKISALELLQKVNMVPRPQSQRNSKMSGQNLQSSLSLSSLEQSETAIEKLAFRFNQVGNWVAHCILQHRELDERVTAIHQFILIAKQRLEFNNYKLCHGSGSGWIGICSSQTTPQDMGAVPYVGVFLKDLTFICDDNPDYLRGGLINVHKRRQNSRTTSHSTRLTPDDELHSLSHELEPKMVVHRRATRSRSSTNLSSTTPNFSFFKPNSKHLSTTTLRT